MSLSTTSFTGSCSDLFSSERYEGLAHLVTKFWLGSVVIGSEALAFISNMVSGLSTRSIEESAREAVLIGSISNPSTLISMV